MQDMDIEQAFAGMALTRRVWKRPVKAQVLPGAIAELNLVRQAERDYEEAWYTVYGQPTAPPASRKRKAYENSDDALLAAMDKSGSKRPARSKSI